MIDDRKPLKIVERRRKWSPPVQTKKFDFYAFADKYGIVIIIMTPLLIALMLIMLKGQNVKGEKSEVKTTVETHTDGIEYIKY